MAQRQGKLKTSGDLEIPDCADQIDEKSEPVSNRNQVRIFQVWWTLTDLNR